MFKFAIMDSEAANCLTGVDIKISRSNGAVHSATVKSVKKSIVYVEWKEKDAIKAKEIDLSDVCRLNAELIEYLQVSKQTGPSTLPEPTSACAQKTEKKSERPRKSEVPVPVVFSRNFGSRLTYRLRPCTSLMPADESPSQKQPSSSIPGPSAHVLSRIPEVNSVVRKRPSISTKKTEAQVKKVKCGDLNGHPNKQFYRMIEEYRETVEKVSLSVNDPVELHRISVCVRKRPLNKKEITKKEIDVVTIPGNGLLLFHEPKQKVDLTKYLDNQTFQFDYSFDENASNELVYRFTARPLVKAIFEGGMATCFAYGQTGSGKTHTMGGDFSGKVQNSSKGIYALAAHDVFSLLKQKRYADLSLYMTFFEIYNSKVFDLLNNKLELRVLEDENQQVQVVGLKETPALCVEDVIKIIEKGSACRTSGQTFANATSSRSHAVLQIILKRRKLIHGKFSLVDLAGNERGPDVSSNDRQTMIETAEINRSLLALKECIRSLGKNSEHIPFRMSKLTQVLRDSFIGENSRTCMIAMISPGMTSCDYTLNTLRYADRVKELKGLTKGVGQLADLTEESEESSNFQEESSNFIEEEAAPADLDDMSEITEFKTLYETLLHGSGLLKAMSHLPCDVGLPEISLYMKRLQGDYHALQTAVEARQANLV